MKCHLRRLAVSAIPAGLVILLLTAGVAWAAPKPQGKGRPPKKVPIAGGFHASPLLTQFLQGPMAAVEEIVFAVRVPGRDHWYVNFGSYADHSDVAQDRAFKEADGVYWGYGEGGRLCRLNLRTGKLTVLLDDAQGGVRDPQVHYDGKKILFSYRRGGQHTYHLFEINVDGTGMVQLTDGPDDDIEPTYCPDGGIIFGSSRCRRFVNCWYSRVATLYRCDGDGRNIRMLSSNNDHDNTPWMLPDGRVLYMRWEYVDRSQVHFHHLWTMNPDGSGQMIFFGNELGGVAMLDAKPVPGTNKVVVSYSPGHGRPEHVGPVVVLDPSRGPDMPDSVTKISKDGEWRDPYAISEDCFLAVRPKDGIFVMDGRGENAPVYALPESDRFMECHEPRPLLARPREPVRPSQVDPAQATGRLVLEDVYAGRNMEGVPRGRIKKLLVMAQLPKPVNFSGGMQPLTIGGSFTLAQVLGTVPVEPDGSAYVELPALRSIYFAALDASEMSVKRMHSFLVLQPGETLSCVGCHEQRNATPPSKPDLAALGKPPQRVTPIRDMPDVLDFTRDVQPILDRHCVACHNPDRYDGRIDLCGDKTGMYTVAYWTITDRQLISDGRNEPRGNRPPYSIGTSASRLMKLVDGSHYKAQPSPHELQTLRLWIETGATYPGTYASLGCGDYPAHLPYGELYNRCGQCHVQQIHDRKGDHPELRFVGHWPINDWLYNLTRPEKSLVLRAPLSRKAGGLDLCKADVFTTTDDPVYQHCLAAIRNAQSRLSAGKRFDMPGFRPNEHYVREMQRFGILPKDLKPDSPINPYAVDRAYWQSFDWKGRQ